MSRVAITETSLWDWLKKAENGLDRELHMRRIENLVGVGDADVSGCYLGRYFDIELKTAGRPARATTNVLNSKANYIRPEQKVWHRSRWAAGGNNFVLLQIGSLKDARRYLIPGLYIRSIEDRTEDEIVKELDAMPFLSFGQTGPLDVINRAVSYRSALGA